jgi:hypothetical protein
LPTCVGADAHAALVHAHAHNDYNHKRPLLDALEHGFASVEADVFLKDGALLVGHNAWDLRADRTLTSLYLDPLKQWIADHQGRVFAGEERLTLLIDFKTEGLPTYAALAELLKRYDGAFSEFVGDQFTPRAVDVVVTGNRPVEAITADRNRRVAIDGRLQDASAKASKELVPLVSENWADHFRWLGGGEMPAAERERLRALVEQVHGQGRRLRFWGAPDSRTVWKEQLDAGVDVLNADDLDGLRDFLIRHRPRAGR